MVRGWWCAGQGVQLVGRPEEAGAGCEGAPAALLDRVIAFLAQERARLRADVGTRMLTAGERSCLCSPALQWWHRHSTHNLGRRQQSMYNWKGVQRCVIALFDAQHLRVSLSVRKCSIS